MSLKKEASTAQAKAQHEQGRNKETDQKVIQTHV